MKIIVGLNRLVITILLGFLIILAGCAREAPVSQTPPPTGLVVVKQSGGAGLLIAECQDKQYIITTADYIVEGMVELYNVVRPQDNAAGGGGRRQGAVVSLLDGNPTRPKEKWNGDNVHPSLRRGFCWS